MPLKYIEPPTGKRPFKVGPIKQKSKRLGMLGRIIFFLLGIVIIYALSQL